MAIQTITFTDKTQLYPNSDVADVNKVKAADMNEIKNVVNNNASELTSVNTSLNNNIIYSTDSVEIGKWVDGEILYRKILVIDNLPNITSTTYPVNFTNLGTYTANVVRVYGTAIEPTGHNSIPLPYVYTGTGSIEITYLGANHTIRVTTETDRTAWTGYIFIEYTLV